MLVERSVLGISFLWVNAPIHVLIAEDDENDALLLRRAIARVDPAAAFHIVPDGQDAVDYLRGVGQYANRAQFPFPRVLITDLKMPKMTGFDLLGWLQGHPECNVIPKIVFSASNIAEDVIRAYQLGANIYFRKPASFDSLLEIAELNFRIWANAELPAKIVERCS